MKKTLMVLSFALCATFAFAQVKTAKSLNMAQKVSTPSMSQAQYKASIFTKDDEEVVESWDFSAANDGYTFGVVNQARANAYLPEAAVVHTATQAFAEWNYIANLDSATLAQASTIFSTLNSFMFGGDMVHRLPRYMDSASCTGYNGFAMMSLLGITDYSGIAVDSYIEFDPVDMSASGVYDVSFYQLYVKFYDHCYIDYSTNGGTSWNTMEINRSGVDVAQQTLYGDVFTYTLPQAACAANTKLRLRYCYNGMIGTTPWQYAYFWAVDDFSITRGETNRWKGHTQSYCEGAYQMMPKGLELPIFWFADIENNGVIAQNNVNVNIYQWNMAGTDSVLIDTYANGNIAAEETKNVMVDGAGRSINDPDNYEGWYANSQHIQRGMGNGLVTDEEGEFFVQTQVVSDSNKLNYRAIYYTVNDAAADSTYIWGHDNGILRNKSAYTFGFIAANTYSDDAETYMDAGYQVTLRYTTGPEIPVDDNEEPWVIRGVQYVPGTTPSKLMGISHISPVLMAESVDSGSLRFLTVPTGVNDVTVDANDYTDSTSILDRGGYLEYGEYPVITVEFPEQPELSPNTSYRLGYELAQNGVFSLATSAGNVYYQRDESTTSGLATKYFSNDSTLAYLGTSFITGSKLPNVFDMYLEDNMVSGGYTWPGVYTDYYPAIRMIVGPRRTLAQYQVTAECEFEDNDSTFGALYNNSGYYACGTIDTFNQGSSFFYWVIPEDGCTIDKLWVDGNVVTASDPNVEVITEGWKYHFNNIAADHTIKARFAFQIGIDRAAANVRMNLQPNPATSQVKLSIEGVNGMVNCSLVDMSGRVVYSANINAENTETINVSNLAKGAYFVRITNNDFTKVEKLIVR